MRAALTAAQDALASERHQRQAAEAVLEGMREEFTAAQVCTGVWRAGETLFSVVVGVIRVRGNVHGVILRGIF